MGARGAAGFYYGEGSSLRKNHKVMYNHFDSYPDYLGVNVLEGCRKFSIKKMREIFPQILLVDAQDIPSQEELESLEVQLGGNPNTNGDNNWYWLLRDFQGGLEKVLEHKIMTNGFDFLGDGLFCEYAYIINLNTGELEVYRGFSRGNTAVGRYTSLKDKNDDMNYDSVTFLTSFDLMEYIPSDQEFLDKIKSLDPDD